MRLAYFTCPRASEVFFFLCHTMIKISGEISLAIIMLVLSELNEKRALLVHLLDIKVDNSGYA